MLEDVNTGIAWVMRKIERHGGDPDNVTLVGQSAGGQLAALALIRQVISVLQSLASCSVTFLHGMQSLASSISPVGPAPLPEGRLLHRALT